MDLISPLIEDLGLTETEAKIYLAGLSRESVGVRDLVRVTGIKRPTVYHALETLTQKGIAAKKLSGGKNHFAMTPPERIGSLLDRNIDELARQKKSFAALLPHFAKLSKSGAVATEVTQFDGADGVKGLVEEALYCRSRKWDIIAPAKNFFSDFDKKFAAYFMETRRARGIVARSLWEPRTDGSSWRVLSAEDLRLRQPRYLPKTMHGKFPSVIILFDDKVALITSAKQPSGVLIRSADIHATMSAMFEGLYAVSEPYGMMREIKAKR